MNRTSPPPHVESGGATTAQSSFQRSRWLRHAAFAVSYVLAFTISASAVYSGTLIAVAWPSVGVAVWWAVTCRSRSAFIWVCAMVFGAPAVYFGILQGLPTGTVLLVSFSHVIGGPAVASLMALFERVHPTEHRSSTAGDLAPLGRVESPRHVYRLLGAALITLPIAQALNVLGLVIDGADVSIALYTSLVLLDLAGIIAVAGPGIAMSSSAWRGITAAVIREVIAAVIVTAVLLTLIFGPGQNLPIVYLAMLPLYWTATRLPVSAAAIHAVITAVTATVLAYWVGAGPFGVSDGASIEQASALQLFIIMCVLLSLVVSTTVQQHARLVAQLEALTATIPDALLVVDRLGQATPVNAAARSLIVPTQDGKFTTRPLRKVDGTLLDESTMPSARALQGETVRGMVVELADVDPLVDEQLFYSVRASPLYQPGEVEPGQALLLYHDSTDAHYTLQQLQRAHDEARHLFDHAPQGVATLDNDGMILQANEALGELVGVPAIQLRGRWLDDFTGDDDLGLEIAAALGGPGKLVQADRSFHVGNGPARRVALSFRMMTSEGSTHAPLLVNAVDVTERQRLHELVSHLADHDAVTGLVNRRRFESEFERILTRSTRGNGDGALLLIDLDNFKLVNDLLGHQAGDELLVEFADLLKECVRSDDVVGRYGGDEFVIVLPDTDSDAATGIATRIIETVHDRFGARTNVLRRVTASIGIAMFSEANSQDVSPLILADQLLYAAKHSGRNRFAALGSEPADSQPAPALTLQDRAEHILEAEALRLELQPIAETATGRIALAEGLVRVHSSEPPIAPGEFVATLEQAGLGPDLDACVLRQGISLLPALQHARPGFRLSLNLSAQSLALDETVRLVMAELDKHQIAPGSLILEVTETAPIEDMDTARRLQRTLRDRGVAFAIDDFGIGFDPYRYLKELDFEILKVAGEFVRGMVGEGADRSIVRSFASLAAEQGMVTIGEYVSDEQIFAAVQRAGITYAQGYHIGASVLPETFIATHLTEP